ncbi:MAG: DUF3419 family protein [Synechococcaceae cyanobacterium]|nr:DUF3419 family protein [Synechococcaceae cyanobacterium]
MNLSAPRHWRIRYAQCWEDADRLVEALQPLAGRQVLSIASGGENTLALLAEAPERLVALDHNPAQLAALELKAAAIARLEHGELMVLLGAWDRPEGPAPGLAAQDGRPDRVPQELVRHRLALYQRCRDRLSPAAAAFWDHQPATLAIGLLHGGRFERYLARFRRWLLPLLRHPSGWQALLAGQSEAERRAWVAACRRDWRWRLLFRLFFSRAALGGLGTAPAQVRYGGLPQGELLLARLEHALTRLDPCDNPYLHWILLGRYGAELPRALRPEQLARIRPHLGRLELRAVSLETWLAAADEPPVQRFNLSNVFEAQSPQATTALLGGLHRRAAAGARLVCWNRLAERDAALAPPRTWTACRRREQELHGRDRVFFYRRLVVAEALTAGGAAPVPGGEGHGAAGG